MQHLHNGAGLQRNRREKLGGLHGGGIPVEEVDGVVFGFFAAYPLSWSQDDVAAWLPGAGGGLRGCCRWRGLGQSFARLQHGRG